MESHSEIIDELGGYAKLAEALGLPKGTVSAMKTRSSIPSEHWPDIAKVAAAQGKPEITIDLLAALQPPRQRRAPATAPSTAPAADDIAPPTEACGS